MIFLSNPLSKIFHWKNVIMNYKLKYYVFLLNISCIDLSFRMVKFDFQPLIYNQKESLQIMILYFNKPETEVEISNIFIDFASIHSRVKTRFPESTLYRLLQKKCHPIRYQNRDLYPYQDIMSIPEIYAEMKNYEYE